jgi:hypothetical protein
MMFGSRLEVFFFLGINLKQLKYASAGTAGVYLQI